MHWACACRSKQEADGWLVALVGENPREEEMSDFFAWSDEMELFLIPSQGRRRCDLYDWIRKRARLLLLVVVVQAESGWQCF